MSPFEFLNSINDTKVDIMVDDVSEKAYNAYLINRGLSYFVDTILLANEMNRNHHLAAALQFHFLINTIRKKKRFSKWIKATEPEALAIVQEYYGYSNEKARSALAVLSGPQIEELRRRLFKGGRTKSKSK